MNREEQQAILTISLMAAFADGRKDALELLPQNLASMAIIPLRTWPRWRSFRCR